MSSIAILGTGPSALFSIMACNDNNIYPKVFGRETSVAPAGAFYYHWLPNSYSKWLSIYPIKYEYLGNEEGYIKKQWGDIKCKTSFGKYSIEQGFDPIEVFSLFMELGKYERVPKGELTTENIFSICEEFDEVICTFPLKEMKMSIPLIFRPVQLKLVEGRSENSITYCGSGEIPWVRQSILFGKKYIEYAKAEDIPESERESSTIAKVPDIHPEASAQFPLIPSNLHFIGRYAEFNRKRLAHEAYDITKEIIHAI